MNIFTVHPIKSLHTLTYFHYSDDAEKMFEEAKVVSPDRKITISTALSNTTSTGKYWLGRKTSGSTASTGSHPTEAYDCEICFLSLPKSVR